MSGARRLALASRRSVLPHHPGPNTSGAAAGRPAAAHKATACVVDKLQSWRWHTKPFCSALQGGAVPAGCGHHRWLLPLYIWLTQPFGCLAFLPAPCLLRLLCHARCPVVPSRACPPGMLAPSGAHPFLLPYPNKPNQPPTFGLPKSFMQSTS